MVNGLHLDASPDGRRVDQYGLAFAGTSPRCDRPYERHGDLPQRRAHQHDTILRQVAGYRIASGKLDADRVFIQMRQLKGDNKTVIEQLTLGERSI
jgi:hypothetical protein